MAANYAAAGGQGWAPENGFCSCMSNVPSCLEGWWCPWCLEGYVHSNVLPPVSGARVKQMDTTYCCVNLVGTICCGSIVMAFFSCQSRKTAKLYLRIPEAAESDCMTCLMGFCCGCCSTTQIARELMHRGDWAGSLCADAKLGAPLPGAMGGKQVGGSTTL